MNDKNRKLKIENFPRLFKVINCFTKMDRSKKKINKKYNDYINLAIKICEIEKEFKILLYEQIPSNLSFETILQRLRYQHLITFNCFPIDDENKLTKIFMDEELTVCHATTSNYVKAIRKLIVTEGFKDDSNCQPLNFSLEEFYHNDTQEKDDFQHFEDNQLTFTQSSSAESPGFDNTDKGDGISQEYFVEGIEDGFEDHTGWSLNSL